MKVRIEFEAYIVRHANRYVLVPTREGREILATLVNKRGKLTLIHSSGVYEMEVTISANPKYKAVVFLPSPLEPTWKKLHETPLKAIIEVDGDGGR